jgi:two-component system alkaline phosphatase synthesis response regulator PhoP
MPKKVLLVDDDYDFLTTTRTVIESGGYQVEEAHNGEEGLQGARKGKPDLIVLDVMMPGMDGWEVCEALKEDRQTAGIPVIMLTAVASKVKDSSYTHQPGKHTEAEDYYPKPVDPAVLLQRIRRLIG